MTGAIAPRLEAGDIRVQVECARLPGVLRATPAGASLRRTPGNPGVGARGRSERAFEIIAGGGVPYRIAWGKASRPRNLNG